MNTWSVLADSRLLQMHWTEQFIKESQLAIERETIAETAQTVLFYASLYLELEEQKDTDLRARGQSSWLSSEQEIVAKALELVPAAYHGLLQMCSLISSLTVDLELQDNELKALRLKASSFIDYVGERAQLEHWFH
ncbi:hypothetical protein [Paenibacillus sp. OAS669]|uniref:hypothetical protein n=1 Tax=Paenibacillus sp. OAS669 TaxID=2663821 RepID=UPI00178AED8A|nr:hypothetical protein [Paenibacillus sp. OAS669]MBE1447398.1 hypothetical protein [Paenibacillus sp. OAS669]